VVTCPMIRDYDLDPPLDCSCGAKVYTYAVAYGPCPYLIQCKSCGFNLFKINREGFGGLPENAFKAWNDYHQAKLMTPQQKIKAVLCKLRAIRSTLDGHFDSRLIQESLLEVVHDLEDVYP